MSPASFRRLVSLAASVLAGALTAAAVQAQAPAAAPSWQQGRSAEQDKSTLHPFAIEVTGKGAKLLPIDKLKVPAGFKDGGAAGAGACACATTAVSAPASAGAAIETSLRKDAGDMECPPFPGCYYP